MDELDEPIDPNSSPIRRLFDLVIAEAVEEESRQILFAVASDRFTVSFLRDGEWTFRDQIPLRVFSPLMARLQILAGAGVGMDTFFWTHPDGSEFLVQVRFGEEQAVLTLSLHKP